MEATAREEKRAILRKAGIFSALTTRELAVVEEYSEFTTFPEGATIFRAGTVGDELFIVVAGSVVIRRSVDESNDIDVARYLPGDSFGELDLLYDAPRNASAVAEQETELLVFPKAGERFESVLNEHPAVFARILHKFLAIIADRIRSTNKLVSENAPWVQELRKQVMGDKLTGLLNATYLKEEFGKLLATEGPTSLMMVKPDNFKHINDTFGHEAGDECLKIIASTVQKSIRDRDIGVRLRGNEIAVILTGVPRDESRRIAENMRAKMSCVDLSPAVGQPAGSIPLTVSVAVGTYPDDYGDAQALTDRVHDLLYEARDAGGNQVRTA